MQLCFMSAKLILSSATDWCDQLGFSGFGSVILDSSYNCVSGSWHCDLICFLEYSDHLS